MNVYRGTSLILGGVFPRLNASESAMVFG